MRDIEWLDAKAKRAPISSVPHTPESILIIRDPFWGKMRSCSQPSREASHCVVLASPWSCPSEQTFKKSVRPTKSPAGRYDPVAWRSTWSQTLN